MHEMSIAGDAVNLASDLLEVLILVRQVLKLRRAHKGKVRRIEEKYSPFSQHILLRYLFKFIIYKTLYFKLSDFFSN